MRDANGGTAGWGDERPLSRQFHARHRFQNSRKDLTSRTGVLLLHGLEPLLHFPGNFDIVRLFIRFPRRDGDDIVVVEHRHDERIKRLSFPNRWIQSYHHVRLMRVRFRQRVHSHHGRVINLKICGRTSHSNKVRMQRKRNLSSRHDQVGVLERAHRLAQRRSSRRNRINRRRQSLHCHIICIIHVLPCPSLRGQRDIKRHLD